MPVAPLRRVFRCFAPSWIDEKPQAPTRASRSIRSTGHPAPPAGGWLHNGVKRIDNFRESPWRKVSVAQRARDLFVPQEPLGWRGAGIWLPASGLQSCA